MEFEQKVQWLFRYLDSLRDQKALELEAARLQAYAEKVRPYFVGRPGGQSTESRLPDAVGRLIQAHDDLRAEINRCLVMRAEIRAVIQAIPNQRQREVLRRRYILGQKFEAIAKDMFLDLRYTYRLHRRAVLALQIPEPGGPDCVHVNTGQGAPPS